MTATLHRKDTIYDIWTIVGLLIVLSGCAVESSPLQDIADEGLGLIKAATQDSVAELVALRTQSGGARSRARVGAGGAGVRSAHGGDAIAITASGKERKRRTDTGAITAAGK